MSRGHWRYINGNRVFIEDKCISSGWFKEPPSDVIEVDLNKYFLKTGIKREKYFKNSEPFKPRIKEAKQVNEAGEAQGEIVKKIATKSLLGLGASFFSAVTLNPVPLLAYKAYLAGNTSYSIIKKIDENDWDKKLNLAKESLKTGIEGISHLKIKNFVDGVSNILDSSGFIAKVSEETSFDPQFVKDSFENIMSGLLESGMNNIVVRMVDAL